MASIADWDRKHRAAGTLPEPDGLLEEARAHLPARAGGLAADIACGSGRHAVRMASWGLRALAIDFSEEALRLCRERAEAAGVSVDTQQLDLEDPAVDLGCDRFDAVTVFNFLHRPLVPVLKRCVRRGGIVIYKTFTRQQIRFAAGPRSPRYLLRSNELGELFSDFRHIVYRESCASEATAALVARRP